MTTKSKPQSYKPQGICYTQFVINFDVDENDELICKDVRTLGDGCKGMISTLNSLIKGRKAKEVVQELDKLGVCKNNTSCAMELSKAINESILVHSGVDITQLHNKRKPPITNLGLTIQNKK